ncbi:hypothetical protein EYF80_004206 [Liparis tanakae]|uniref:Uncharacterized protein n=1 Tax=Liparis tanakae TaxID=230148 RepID=A0A4Z2J7I7_9TELE|nr:hypothetical protein EYF80_004206 [Liparis tanakae]
MTHRSQRMRAAPQATQPNLPLRLPHALPSLWATGGGSIFTPSPIQNSSSFSSSPEPPSSKSTSMPHILSQKKRGKERVHLFKADCSRSHRSRLRPYIQPGLYANTMHFTMMPDSLTLNDLNEHHTGRDTCPAPLSEHFEHTFIPLRLAATVEDSLHQLIHVFLEVGEVSTVILNKCRSKLTHEKSRRPQRGEEYRDKYN